MRFRVGGRGWPLKGGSFFASGGTIIDTAVDDMWSQAAAGLLPSPSTATPLDAEAWQAQFAAYPEERHLLGPEPAASKQTSSK
jgi:hypothetical protein